MTLDPDSIHVAVIGSGLAGTNCAAGLQRAGMQVALFENSRNVGGRVTTRRAGWIAVRRFSVDRLDAEFPVVMAVP